MGSRRGPRDPAAQPEVLCDAGGHHRWSAHAGGADRPRLRDRSTVRAAVERKVARPCNLHARVDPAICGVLVIAMMREMTRTQQKDAF